MVSPDFIIERFRSPISITIDEIKKWHEEGVSPDVVFDKKYTLNEVIHRLYRATNTGQQKFCVDSTNGAFEILDEKTQKCLFIDKSGSLSADLGIRKNKGIAREHLYYLLDNEGFAGVPPTFYVSIEEREHSFCWYRSNCSWWDGLRTEENKAALRKCLIHQFRTVNVDPGHRNILVRKGSNTVFPIDGGHSLPTTLGKGFPFAIPDSVSLLAKPYLNTPFTEEEKAYIEKIDIEKDEALIRGYFKRPDLNVLKIFHVANLLLKKAIETSQITLHDLCNIRDLKAYQGDRVTILFEQIMESDLNDVTKRIDSLFQDIIQIKEKILTSEDSPECTCEQLLTTIDPDNYPLRKLAVVYCLGKEGYETHRKEKTPFGELLKRV